MNSWETLQRMRSSKCERTSFVKGSLRAFSIMLSFLLWRWIPAQAASGRFAEVPVQFIKFSCISAQHFTRIGCWMCGLGYLCFAWFPWTMASVTPPSSRFRILWCVDIFCPIAKIADFQKFDFFGKSSSFPRCLRFQRFWDPRVRYIITKVYFNGYVVIYLCNGLE